MPKLFRCRFGGDTKDCVYQVTVPGIETVQKVGYFIQYAGKYPNRQQLKMLDNEVTNAEIQCMVHDLEYTKENLKKIFNRIVKPWRPTFNYKNSDKILTIDYEQLISGNKEELNQRLRTLIST